MKSATRAKRAGKVRKPQLPKTIPPKPKSNRRRARKARRKQDLPECVRKYAVALVDPFDPRAVGACAPIMPSTNSNKVSAWSRFSMAIGTAGVGFVAFAPQYSNDQLAVWYTTAAFAGTQFTTTVGSGIAVASLLNAQFNQSAYAGGGIRGRPVGAGLRVRYTGTTLNQAGMIFGLVEPDHLGFSPGTSIAILESFPECRRKPVSRSTFTLPIVPVDMDELQYSAIPYGQNTLPSVLIMVTGVPGQTLYAEALFHFETIGQLAPNRTPNQVYPDMTMKAVSLAGKFLSTTAPFGLRAAKWLLSQIGSPITIPLSILDAPTIEEVD